MEQTEILRETSHATNKDSLSAYGVSSPERSHVSKLGIVAVVLLSSAAFGGILCGCLYSQTFCATLFNRGSYYVVLSVLLSWVAYLAWLFRNSSLSISKFARSHALELCVAGAVTLFCFHSVAPKLRVLSDEANLLSVSESMLLNKTVSNITGAKVYYGNMHVVAQVPEKRPFLFPFLVQCLHIILGYSYQNGFYLNGLLLFALLTLIGVVVRQQIGSIPAVATMIVVATCPIICQCATSAGFELLMSVVLCCVLVTLFRFLKTPGRDNFALLWLTLVLFAHTRYECILAIPIVMIALLWFRYLKWEYFTTRWYIYTFTPWALLPLILQRKVITNQFDGAQGQPFSFEFFKSNLVEFLSAQIRMDYFLPYPTVLTLTSVLIAIALGITLYKNRAQIAAWQWHFGVVAASIVAMFLVMYLCFFFGKYTHPSSARYFLFLSLFIALIPAIYFCLTPGSHANAALPAFAAVSLILYHPVSINGEFTNSQTAVRQSEAEIKVLESFCDRSVLVVSDRSVVPIACGYGCIDFNYFQSHKATILLELKRHLYPKVIVFQNIQYQTNAAPAEQQLGREFSLTTVQELELTSAEFLRASWLTPNEQ